MVGQRGKQKYEANGVSGPEPINVILDIMERPNVHPVLGNRDYVAVTVRKKMDAEITEDNLSLILMQRIL